SMIAKNCGGILPEPGVLTDADNAILASADGLLPRVEAEIDAFAIHRALEVVWGLIADANRYFASEEPWAHKKTNPERMGTILYVTAEVVRQAAILAQAAMPESGGKLLDMLSVPEKARGFDALGEAGRLKSGAELPAPTPVFPRYVEPESEAS
ncbi:MAG: methionine--tRNA ligase, partial [Methyloceanibacter sp.]